MVDADSQGPFERVGRTWENESGPRVAGNELGGLTRISDITRKGLGMKPTRPATELPINGGA